MTAQNHDLLDLIETAISDSMDMDWTPRLGAEHVYRAMEREGVVARLIAADPDMLEAFKRIAASNGMRPGHVEYLSRAEIAAIALDAIDKAEGRS